MGGGCWFEGLDVSLLLACGKGAESMSLVLSKLLLGRQDKGV